jgi:hypothetical protein
MQDKKHLNRPFVELTMIIQTVLETTAACTIFHYILRRVVYSDRNTSYFLFHSIFNALIVYHTIADTIFCFMHPLYSMSRPYSILPILWLAGFHLSHIILDFRHMVVVDWLHHLLSVFVLCGLNVMYTIGPLSSMSCFFASGLPGGLDYFCLFLVKTKRIDSLTEKYINRYLNMWCRVPGLLLWMGFAWTCWTSGNVHMVNGQQEMPLWAVLVNFLFLAGTAIFFGDRVVVSYGRHLERQLHKK